MGGSGGVSRRFVALAIAWLEWQKGLCLAYRPKTEARHAHMANRSHTDCAGLRSF